MIRIARVLYLLITNDAKGLVYLALPIAMAEITFPTWLLIKGLNAVLWKKRGLEAA